MPILTPNGAVSAEEMNKAAREEKLQAYIKDVRDNDIKHKMMQVAVLKSSPNTIKATLDIVDLTKEMIEEIQKV